MMGFDASLCLIYLNANAAKLFGRDESELLGTHIERSGAVGEILIPSLLEVSALKSGISREHEILGEGSARMFQAVYSPLVEKGGELTGIFAILREITDRRSLLRQIAASKKRLETQAKALEVFDIVSESDLSGDILYANEKFCRLSQYSRTEIQGKNYRMMNSGYHSKSFFQDMWRTISRGRVWCGEIQNRAKDGSYYWVQTIITPVMNDEGKFSRFLAIQRDSTQERDRSLQIDDLIHQHRQIMNLMPHLMVRLDLDRNVLFANRAFLDFAGVSKSDFSEANWIDTFVPMDQRQNIQEELLQLLGDRKNEIQFQLQTLVQEGERREVLWKAIALKNLEGVAVGLELIGEDLSQNGARMSEGSAAQDPIYKRDVIGFVSHELRSGLTSVESGLSTIQEQVTPHGPHRADVGTVLEKVLGRVRQLNHLSRNLLENLARVSQPIRIKFQPLSLRAFLLSLAEQFRDDLPAGRSLKFSAHLPDQDVVVQWDRVKIEQALHNLLRNAVQYSKPEGGCIALSAAVTGNQVLLSIADQGIGIPTENVETIFELFTRGDNTDQKGLKSFGVGLKFCKDVAIKHRGRIWVESKLGTGTTIYLLLPADPKSSLPA